MELQLVDLTKSFGKKTVVNHVNLTLKPGIIGLLGPNGAGKTTMIRLLCDLLKADSGEVQFNGKNIVSMDEEYRSLLGYLPQKVGYYPWFSAKQYLEYIASLKGIPEKKIPSKVEDLLKQVGLLEEQNQKLKTFSGGMLQRSGIAQALLNDPKILIFDEPTAGLDPQERIRFRSMITSIAKDRLIILSTHVVSDIEHIATDVILFNAGSVVAYDKVQNIRNTLTDQVYTILVPLNEVEHYRNTYLISNMQPVEDQVLLRIICQNQRVPDHAKKAEAGLEDAYLAYCGQVNL